MSKNSTKAILIIVITLLTAALIGSIIISINKKGKTDIESNAEVKEVSSVSITESTVNQRRFIPVNNNKQNKLFNFETPIYKIVFDSAGASVKSIILKEYSEADKELDLILKSKDSDRAFMMYEGRKINNNALPIDAQFDYSIDSNNNIIFENDFYLADKEGKATDKVVKIKKTYKIGEKEYMIAIKVDVIPVNCSISDIDGYIYSIGFEPQIGPEFSSSSSKQSGQNIRNFQIKLKNKKKASLVGFSGNLFTYEQPFEWFELTGKYFSYIIAPQGENFHISAIKEGSEKEKNLTSSSYLARTYQDGQITDIFNIYLGPQLKNKMNVFNRPQDNSFGVKDLYFEKGLESGGMFNWLQIVLKWIMTLFYSIIPNWGVSIILLTLFIKILLFPLQQKSLKSSARMGEVSPKLKEIKEKYKDDPEKMNAATMALYKEADIHPFMSFIPTLIQFPILLAMYGLLNKHFELRGAMFIPGWIMDLSAPESVLSFPFTIPFIGNELHLLPIIYLATMMLLMIYTQKSTGGANNGAMQIFMTYFFPIIFFFVLYNTSSGLLLYWTMSNVFSIIQQFFTNIFTKKKKVEQKIKAEKQDKEHKPILYSGVLPPKAKRKEK